MNEYLPRCKQCGILAGACDATRAADTIDQHRAMHKTHKLSMIPVKTNTQTLEGPQQ
ncbi:MAG: hypothetical protein UHD09_07640 [Bifidobacterium sp.]|nr:hypothetical protein [Bifidobacterium sp.]